MCCVVGRGGREGERGGERDPKNGDLLTRGEGRRDKRVRGRRGEGMREREPPTARISEEDLRVERERKGGEERKRERR